MARFQAVQTNFRVGQISPRLQGYVDLPDYQNALKTLENFVVLPQSSVTRRPGTRYVNTTYNNVQSRLIPFNFGQAESYALELSAGRIRIFYVDPADNVPKLIPDGTGTGTSSDGITTYTDRDGASQTLPWTADDLDQVNWTQSADTLFIVSPNFMPLRLKRTGASISDWYVDEFPFKNGPYLPVNSELTWLRPTGVSAADYNDVKLGEIPIHQIDYYDTDGNFMTITNHGLVDGEKIYFDGDMPSDLNAGPSNPYYVINSTPNTFKISETRGGDAVDLVNTGNSGDSMHVHKQFIGVGAKITLTAYKGEEVKQCTFNQSTDTFTTIENHGLVNTDQVRFKTGSVDGFALDKTYYIINKTDKTFQLSVSSGGAAVTHAGSDTVPVGGLIHFTESGEHINGGSGFVSSDVGRLIRLNTAVQPAIKWGYAKITSVTSTTEVEVEVLADLGPDEETQSWALGAFSDTTGYPRAATIYQQRMVFAGTEEEPQAVHFSKTGDFDNFATTEPLGEVTGTAVGGTSIFGEQIYDDNALTLKISSDTVDRIVYLSPAERLTVGTTGGVFQMFGSRDDVTLTPFNFSVIRIAAWSAADSRPVEIGNNLLYIQQANRKIRELDYSRVQDEYAADDLTIRAENVSQTGIVEMLYQDQPNSLVWARRRDGKVACLTYVKDVPVIAWHLHTIGGSHADATYGNHAKVESMCVIPQADHDQLWMIVKRDIWGGMTAVSSVTLNETTGVFTKTSHGYSDGDQLAFDGTAPNGFEPETVYYVVSSATNTFSLASTADGTAINPDGTETATAVSTMVEYSESRYVEVMQRFFDASEIDANDAWHVDCGVIREGTGTKTSTIDTLTHLEGETVRVYADAAPQPTREVSSGTITLELPADHVIAGLGYDSNFETLPLAVGTRENSSVGQRKRIHRMIVQLLDSMGLKYGVSADNLFEEDFRLTTDLLDQALPLFNGQIELALQSAFTRTGEVYLRQDQALPMTITLLALDYETND